MQVEAGGCDPVGHQPAEPDRVGDDADGDGIGTAPADREIPGAAAGSVSAARALEMAGEEGLAAEAADHWAAAGRAGAELRARVTAARLLAVPLADHGPGAAGPAGYAGSAAPGATATPAASASPGATATRPPGATAVIFGLVQAGPSCPVDRVYHACRPHPLGDIEVQARLPSTMVAASARTETGGHYSLTLAPGRYLLVVMTAQMFPRCPHVLVSVRSGSAIRANINCDTGLRQPEPATTSPPPNS